MMYKLITLWLAIIGISACSNHYDVSTNLDKKNFEAYFAASDVQIYADEQALPEKHQFIGIVEGQDCQVKPHHAEPDEVNARTQARKNAYQQKANAIVFTGCATLTPAELAQQKQSNDAKQCHAVVICYGKAFSVEQQSR